MTKKRRKGTGSDSKRNIAEAAPPSTPPQPDPPQPWFSEGFLFAVIGILGAALLALLYIYVECAVDRRALKSENATLTDSLTTS